MRHWQASVWSWEKSWSWPILSNSQVCSHLFLFFLECQMIAHSSSQVDGQPSQLPWLFIQPVTDLDPSPSGLVTRYPRGHEALPLAGALHAGPVALHLAGRVQRDSLRGSPGGGWPDLSRRGRMGSWFGWLVEHLWWRLTVSVGVGSPKRWKNWWTGIFFVLVSESSLTLVFGEC